MDQRSVPSRNPASAPAFFSAQENVPYSSEPVSDDTSSFQRRLSMKRKQTLVSLLNEIVSLKEEDFDLDAGPEEPAHAAVSERIKNLTIEGTGASDTGESPPAWARDSISAPSISSQQNGFVQATLDELEHLFVLQNRLHFWECHEIGAGGYGAVLLATLDGESSTPRDVAVKQLRPPGTRVFRQRLAKRLIRELKIWSSIKHPNLLELLGFYLGRNIEVAQLVSPFLCHGNVSQYIARLGVKPVQRVSFVRDITSGMDYLHRHDPPICHGDLKPANVLINNKLDAVLCDFGLAKFINDSDTPSGLTTSRTIKGSIRYMSPELVVENDAKHTLASDIWAWGCTAFEILTERMPYHDKKNDTGVLLALVGEKKPGSIELLPIGTSDSDNPDCIQALQCIGSNVALCWDFNPQNRPSMFSVLAQLTSSGLDHISKPAKDHSSIQDGSATMIGQTGYAGAQWLSLLSLPNGHTDLEEPDAPRPAGLAKLIPKSKALTGFKPVQEIIRREGLVKHLQFSPDGKWLATCTPESGAMIWKVGSRLSPHCTLTRVVTGFLNQLTWSPDGKYLLTRAARYVDIWLAETGALEQKISCESETEAVTWMPGGYSFACLEESVVHIMNLQGEIRGSHVFEDLVIHGIFVTNDEQRMILLATTQSTKDNLVACKSKAEKHVIVYHLVDKKVECQVPILENIRDVIISSDTSNGYLALVSYEDMRPPELWRISVVNVEARQEARVQLLQTYMPTAGVGFAGPTYLGGNQDQFVICAGKKGDIDIWDRETGLLLHSLQGANLVDNIPEDLTGVAWNHSVSHPKSSAMVQTPGSPLFPQVFPDQGVSSPGQERAPWPRLSHDPLPQDDTQDPTPPPTLSPARMRFKDAVKKVRVTERMKPTPKSCKIGLGSVASNHCAPGRYMFASATNDGTIRIWTT